MKRLLLLGSGVLIAAMLGFAPLATQAGHWQQQAGYWYYQDDDGYWYYHDGGNYYWWNEDHWEFYAPWSTGYSTTYDGTYDGSYESYPYGDRYYRYPYRSYGPGFEFHFGDRDGRRDRDGRGGDGRRDVDGGGRKSDHPGDRGGRPGGAGGKSGGGGRGGNDGRGR